LSSDNKYFTETERDVTWRSLLRSRVNSSVEREITLTFIVSRRERERELNQFAEKNPERGDFVNRERC
jgi:hypothetical protein